MNKSISKPYVDNKAVKRINRSSFYSILGTLYSQNYLCPPNHKRIHMSLELAIKEGIINGLKSLYDVDLELDKAGLQPTKKEFEGKFTFVTFPYAGRLRKAPEMVGEELGNFLKENVSEVSGFNCVKGFLNIEISDSSWVETFKAILGDEQFGFTTSGGENVMVEYSSPNTNKPLHLGHLRNNFLGYSISKILKANGHHVTMANLINDRGIHICKSMIAYEKFGNGETPESANIKGDHLAGKYYVAFDKAYKEEINSLKEQGVDEEEAKKTAPLMLETQEMLRKWENNDPEVRALWEKMNGWVYDGFNATYKKIGVEFDQFYYESDTYLLGKDIVEEGLEKEVFFKKEDHSVWADLEDQGLDQKLVLRGDGTSVYITQDMGTADLKYKDYTVSKSIYVVGNEQDYHFDVLKRILMKLEKPYAEGIYHMSYGMVDLPSGKMKSREGTVVDADDLVQEMIDTAAARTKELGKIDGLTEDEANTLYRTLALGALKYFILKVDPKRRMLFDPKESIDFQGNTGPFIQYTHARISAIVRKAAEEGIDPTNTDYEANVPLTETEIEIINIINTFGKKINDAGSKYAPSTIAAFVYDLAKSFNKFYAETPIFKSEGELLNFRIAFCYTVARTIKAGMGLLGIDVPERM